MAYMMPESIIFDCVAVHIMPLWILYMIGVRAYLLKTLIQLVYLHVIYKRILAEKLETYAGRLIGVTTLTVVMNTALILSTQYDLAKAQNEVAREKLKKAELERQKTFLLSFSHELRNFINIMIGNVQFSLLENIPPKVKELLQNSEVCGELLLHLINNILDTGKVEIGELEVTPVTKAVGETFEKVWSDCSQLINSKGLTGQMRIQSGIPKLLKIDSYRVIQILINLIGNSIKFTETGGVNIHIDWIEGKEEIDEECFEPVPFDTDGEGLFEKDQVLAQLDKNLFLLDFRHSRIPTLKTNYNASKGILKFTVSDTGIGIPSDKLPFLFSKFHQLSSDPDKRKLGTGLGLFITKQLVQKMGGEIKVFSKENQGTVVMVCFRAESVAIEGEGDLGNNKMARIIRAMIVDDVKFNQVILANVLSKSGVQVDAIASNGKEAVEEFKNAWLNNRNPFDMITLDIDMPIMDGKKALK